MCCLEYLLRRQGKDHVRRLMLLAHYRKNLRAIVGSAAAPYGYTLSIWAAGAALISVHGIPKTFAALMFVGGAILRLRLRRSAGLRGHTGAVRPRKGPRPPVGKPPLPLCGTCDRSSDAGRPLYRRFCGLASGRIFGYEHLPSSGRSRVRHYLPVGA